MNDFDYKLLTEEDLDYIFSDVQFKINPRWHQLVSAAFAIAIEDNRVMLSQGVGTGKTLCSLFVAQIWECRKILVICPTSAFGAWERDIPLGTDFSYTFLIGTKKERIASLKQEHNVKIINYEGLKVLYGHLVKKAGGKREWKINRSALVDNFDCIVFDEVHRCSNYRALQTEICLELSRRSKHVIGMTGTPIDKSMLELFNIYKVIDMGKSLGINFYIHRRTYFYPAGYDWKLKTGSQKKLLEKISGRTISFEREECIDLPELQEIEIPVKSMEEFEKLQNQIMDGTSFCVDGIEMNFSNDEEEAADGAKAQRLRELSGGFFYYEDEDGQRQAYHLKENPKLKALLDLILDSKSKMLVFYYFEEEKKLIEEALQANKIRYISVHGGQGPFERKDIVQEFTEDPDIQVMTAQARISEGFDASVANVIVFYLPLGSPRMRKQCVGRAYRSGQTKKCLAIDLVLEDSVDSRIIKDRGERFSLVQSFKKYFQEYHQKDSGV